MTKSTKTTTKFNMMFLAVILFTGTVVTISPSSLMVGPAQAAPLEDIDREKYADKKGVSVSSLNCNNINVNVNGLELDVFPPFLGVGEAALEAIEPTTDANSFANSGEGSEINDFRFICINNNNNTVVGEAAGNGTIPTPPADPCVDCFINNLDSIELRTFEFVLTGSQFVDLAGLCDFLSDPTNTSEEKRLELDNLYDTANVDPASREAIDNCLVGLGLLPPR